MPKSTPFQLACVASVLLFAHASVCASTLFKPTQAYGSGGANAVSIAVADLNGDGKPDVIVANGCILCFSGSNFGVGVLLGNGDGSFQTATNYSLNGLVAVSVAVGDVNRDGKSDVLVTTACFSIIDCGSGGVSVLLGNGDGTLKPAVAYDSGGFGAHGIAVGDLNGDGKLDVIVTNCASTGTFVCIGQGNISVLLGNGDGTFQSALSYSSGGVNAWSVAIGDVNHDGKLDIVVDNCASIGSGCESAGADGFVGVLLGNGDGTFNPAQTYDSGGNAAGAVAIADVNGDGNPDLLVTNALVAVLLGNGDGTFQPEQTYNSGGSGAESVAVADVNGDGNPDVLVANYFCGESYNCDHGTVGVLLGNANGTFQPALAYSSGGYGAFSLAVADVSGGSRPDVVVANNCAVGANCGLGIVGVLLGNSPPLDITPPAITLSATPNVLRPPNGRLVPVTISGTITDTGSGVAPSSPMYSVRDEYGEVQPKGAISLGAGGSYSFTVLLRASRRGTDRNGREYIIRVIAKDNADNQGSANSRVIVPREPEH